MLLRSIQVRQCAINIRQNRCGEFVRIGPIFSRSFGILDKLNKKVNEEKVQKQEKSFEDSLTRLMEIKYFTWDAFYQQLKTTVKEFTPPKIDREKLSKEEIMSLNYLQRANITIKIIESFPPELDKEARKLHWFPYYIREQIAEKAKCSVVDVNSVIHEYHNQRMMRDWLRKRKTEGKSIPHTEELLKSEFQKSTPTLDRYQEEYLEQSRRLRKLQYRQKPRVRRRLQKGMPADGSRFVFKKI